MKRPLLNVALLYAAGLLLANFLAWPPFVMLGAALLVALAATFCSRARTWLLPVLLVLTGMANLRLHTAILSPQDLRLVATNEAEIVTVRGALRETPWLRVYEHDDEPVWRTIAQIEIHELRSRHGAWRPATGLVMCGTRGTLGPKFFGGREVEVEGVLKLPPPPVVSGQFDYRTYLQRHGIYHQLQIDSTNDWRLAAGANASERPPWSDRFCNWAKANLARGLPVEDEPLRLLWAMTLGWKTALTGEVSEPFMRSGTMHVFAISGLHVALIAGLFVSVLRVVKVPRGWCGAVVIPLIWAYTAATGWQASAIRSTIMMTVIIGGWSLKRPNDLLNSLAAAAFIILLWDPQQLFQASFQLSFFVVLSLALFGPWLGEQSEDLIAPEEFLPDELRSWWQRWLWRGWRWLRLSCVTSLAAWLGSIPLVACYFNLLTPVSLLANLIIVPLSGLALAANVASLALGSIWPALAELFNHSAWLWMKLMIDGSVLAARAPGGCFHVGTPTVLMFVTYYGALIACFAGWLKRPVWRWWIGSALALLALASIIQWQMHHREMRLTIVPLSGGSAQHFHTASQDLLIDCGNASSAEFIIKPYLRAEGIDRLDTLMLTHGDVHHVGGAGFIASQFPPAQVARSPVAFRSTAYREAILEISRRTNLLHTVNRGEVIEGWEVLHPEATDRFPQADDNAIVLRADLRGTRVLLLSDLGKPGQNTLLGRERDLRADIVVSGIPTQTEPMAEALLDAIQPRLIVISDSVYPATARASRKLRERLATRNIPVIFTSETGAAIIIFGEKSWEVRSASGRKIEPVPEKQQPE